ncbi:LPXTG cell wall anchor domain-containing protein [Streptomyces xanthochromogenes]|uniref:SCO1860 family LAETG-anchored protein n=1 Tax=Streptomyces xanthochromogenes TaxID=67384 RepID=UPI00167C1783|nr:SCO1860 family LAETG-anchored protein [Streptomyces xanthochromogenes]GHB28911.1 LPXTG cell wall anchor domain-containing protein [Streptomyces xanthochromogenes]
MNSNNFRLPANVPAGRRSAAIAACTALVAGPLLLAAPAHATGVEGDGGGRASAVVLRTGLDVSLLNKAIDVPLRATLNEVQAPAGAEKTALTVKLDGVAGGQPVNVLKADVATAKASVDEKRAEGSTRLVNARLHLPGLPLLSLIEVGEVTSSAVCEAGRAPVAKSNVLGAVTVLGRKITLSAGGTTRVDVPGVGEVSLDLSRATTTSRTAAAVALQLKISVNPLHLNVADVKGEVTLAEATCRTPKAPPAKPQASAPADPDKKPVETAVKTQNVADTELAETGGSSATPYLAGGAAVLLVGGAGALVLTRMRARGNRG